MPTDEHNASYKVRWYVAEIVLKITVQDDPRNIVHKNLVLIQSKSAQDAYDSAVTLGNENEVSYLNSSGKEVEIRFQGLGKLSAVNDSLGHGAELLYEEYVDVPQGKIEDWVVPKHLLTVFRDIQPSRGPDYCSAEALGKALSMVRKAK
jgi:hypothetical protein